MWKWFDQTEGFILAAVCKQMSLTFSIFLEGSWDLKIKYLSVSWKQLAPLDGQRNVPVFKKLSLGQGYIGLNRTIFRYCVIISGTTLFSSSIRALIKANSELEEKQRHLMQGRKCSIMPMSTLGAYEFSEWVFCRFSRMIQKWTLSMGKIVS